MMLNKSHLPAKVSIAHKMFMNPPTCKIVPSMQHHNVSNFENICNKSEQERQLLKNTYSSVYIQRGTTTQRGSHEKASDQLQRSSIAKSAADRGYIAVCPTFGNRIYAHVLPILSIWPTVVELASFTWVCSAYSSLLHSNETWHMRRCTS